MLIGEWGLRITIFSLLLVYSRIWLLVLYVIDSQEEHNVLKSPVTRIGGEKLCNRFEISSVLVDRFAGTYMERMDNCIVERIATALHWLLPFAVVSHILFLIYFSGLRTLLILRIALVVLLLLRSINDDDRDASEPLLLYMLILD